MMYGWWDYGASPPWFGMFLGPLTMIVFLVVAVLIVAWVLRALGSGRQHAGKVGARHTPGTLCPR